MTDYIIAVDEYDQEIERIEKMEAHQKGLLHRAFSIFVFNSKQQLLLQKRNKEKYHSGGLWTNTCCGHPKHGEDLEEASHRRLKEEMGFNCELNEIFSFSYKIELDNELIENEYDHIFVGIFNGKIVPNENEVEDFKWVDLDEIESDILSNPSEYTFWFKGLFDKVLAHIFSAK